MQTEGVRYFSVPQDECREATLLGVERWQSQLIDLIRTVGVQQPLARRSLPVCQRGHQAVSKKTFSVWTRLSKHVVGKPRK